MNRNRNILIGLVIVGCLWYKCCAGYCDLYLGDTKCGCLFCYNKSFNQKEWLFDTEQEGRRSSLLEIQDKCCTREAMICDLTQNVIPIGTPYEKVITLLGEGADSIGQWIPDEYHDLYNKWNSEVINEKKLLSYASGGNASGYNALVILFIDDKVCGFMRTVAT